MHGCGHASGVSDIGIANGRGHASGYGVVTRIHLSDSKGYGTASAIGGELGPFVSAYDGNYGGPASGSTCGDYYEEEIQHSLKYFKAYVEEW